MKNVKDIRTTPKYATWYITRNLTMDAIVYATCEATSDATWDATDDATWDAALYSARDAVDWSLDKLEENQ